MINQNGVVDSNVLYSKYTLMQKGVERLIKRLSKIKINLAEFETKRDHEFTFEIGIYLIPTQKWLLYYSCLYFTMRSYI